jgi:hypothetical protein
VFTRCDAEPQIGMGKKRKKKSDSAKCRSWYFNRPDLINLSGLYATVTSQSRMNAWRGFLLFIIQEPSVRVVDERFQDTLQAPSGVFQRESRPTIAHHDAAAQLCALYAGLWSVRRKPLGFPRAISSTSIDIASSRTGYIICKREGGHVLSRLVDLMGQRQETSSTIRRRLLCHSLCASCNCLEMLLSREGRHGRQQPRRSSCCGRVLSLLVVYSQRETSQERFNVSLLQRPNERQERAEDRQIPLEGNARLHRGRTARHPSCNHGTTGHCVASEKLETG